MNYEIVQDRNDAGTYRVEAIDHASEGECYVTMFMGPRARERAEEYAAFKNS